MILILCALVISALTYRFLIRPHSYWKKNGIIQTNPTFILGDMWKMLVRKQTPMELVETVYNSVSSNFRYLGMYQFLTPVLLIKDPELIKELCVKHFDHFLDHRPMVQPDADPLFGKNLLLLQGQQWREMRSYLSPAFTSSKMKYMFTLMSQTGEQFVKHFKEQKEDLIKVEMKDALSKFANDVIGNTVFGFQCDSLKEPKNEFFVMAREATDLTSIRKMLVFMGNFVCPKVIKFFKFGMFSSAMTKFFTRIVKENIESREKHNVVRPDMISLLLEARKNNLKHEETVLPDTGFATVEESEVGKSLKTPKGDITDKDITAQAFVFFFAGFDTVSTHMAFMAYELALNPDVQKKLTEEVDKVREECDGKITYEAITTMKYMDMVVSETLRKWPNGIATDRVCTKPFVIEPKAPNESPVFMKKGDLIIIPMYALHRDPKYYPEPERFDPERFNEENKKKIVPYSFLPFGVGPRGCIGTRFALLEAKLLFYYLLSNFEITPIEETPIPIQFNRKAMNMAVEKGYWVGLKPRSV